MRIPLGIKTPPTLNAREFSRRQDVSCHVFHFWLNLWRISCYIRAA